MTEAASKTTAQKPGHLCIFCKVDEGIQLVCASDALRLYALQVHSEVVGSFPGLIPGLVQLGLQSSRSCSFA